MNFNDLGLSMNFKKLNIDFNYLQEDKHIGNQEYIKTKINLTRNENSLVSLETKKI